MNYVIGVITPGIHTCQLESLQKVEKPYQLERGVSRAGSFPNEAYFPMDPDFKKRLELADFLNNNNTLLVVSERVKVFFERWPQWAKNNEFLPVKLKNFKRRMETAPYFIIHQINNQDCIDLAKSVAETNAIDDSQLTCVTQLAVDEARIEPGVALFRMKQYPVVVVFRRDLANAVTAAGFSDIKFHELDTYQYPPM